MELVEIVIQGLKAAPDLARVPFLPSLTVLPAGERERLYLRLLLDQLYPKGGEPSLLDLAAPGIQARVGLTVKGRDGLDYRLLHDVQTGRRALQRVVGDKPEGVSSASNEIAQAVTAIVGFPQEDILRELFFFVKEDLPSKRPKKKRARREEGAESSGSHPKARPAELADALQRAQGKSLPPGFSDEGDAVVESEQQLRSRLAAIDKQLAAQAQIKEMEFEIDGLQRTVFEIESELQPLSTLRRSVKQAEAGLEAYAHLEGVPPDIIQRGVRLKKAREDHARELERIDDEKSALLADHRQLAIDAGLLIPDPDSGGSAAALAVASAGEAKETKDAPPPRPALLELARREKLLVVGLAVGIGAIVLGILGALTFQGLRYLAFLDIPALAAAVVGSFRVIQVLEQDEVMRRRRTKLDEQRRIADERIRSDEKVMKGLLETARLTFDELPELEEKLAARAEAMAIRQSAQAALDAALEGGLGAREEELIDARARVVEYEQNLADRAVGMQGTGELLQEKAAIEAKLRGEEAVERRPPPDEPDHVERLIGLARDLLLWEPDRIVEGVQARAQLILTNLADGRFRALSLGTGGGTSVVDAASTQPIFFDDLPPFDRDLVWVSVKVALIELIAKHGKYPVVVDRALDFLADRKAQVVQGMLRFLSTQTQVVSISEHQALGGAPTTAPG